MCCDYQGVPSFPISFCTKGLCTLGPYKCVGYADVPILKCLQAPL